MLKVLYYQRKPRATGNYSLEAIFDDVRRRLKTIESSVRIAPCYSNGFLRRLWIAMDALWHQREINHITGDITFAAILLPKSRTVVTILDCIGVDTRSGLSGWLYRKVWFECPAKRSIYITTISEASKRDIVRVTGCNPNKVIVTGVAIDVQFQRVDKVFNEERPRILHVGTAPNKNLERLACALAGIPCKLVIVGELNPSQRNALDANNIDVENHVKLEQNALIEQYVQCDVVSFVSVFEGFGMPILEGNSVGRPVITGNCTSMPEVAGDAACIVDPFDVVAIREGFMKVLADPGYRLQLVNNGYANVRRFDPQVIAHRYLSVYELATNGQRK